MERKINRIIITATETTIHDTFKSVEIEDKKQGLFEIGCHFLITRNGVVYKGRSESKEGNFESPYNTESLIVRLVGLGWDFTEEQMRSLFKLEDELSDKYKAEIIEVLPMPTTTKTKKKK